MSEAGFHSERGPESSSCSSDGVDEGPAGYSQSYPVERHQHT